MPGATDYWENKILDAILGDGRAASMPATVYVALFSTAPSDAGGGVELAGSGYARVAVANTTANWPNAAAGQKSNANEILFPVATANWVNATHAAIFDAAAAGNMLAWTNLTTAKTILSGVQGRFGPGTLVFTAD